MYSYNQAREQNFFFFSAVLADKIKTVVDWKLKFGTNLLCYKLYAGFKLWDVYATTATSMASEDDTVLQNTLGTFKEHYFRLRVCALSTDAHPCEIFGHEYKGCAMHCLADIVHKPLSEGQIDMLGTFFLPVKEFHLVG